MTKPKLTEQERLLLKSTIFNLIDEMASIGISVTIQIRGGKVPIPQGCSTTPLFWMDGAVTHYGIAIGDRKIKPVAVCIGALGDNDDQSLIRMAYETIHEFSHVQTCEIVKIAGADGPHPGWLDHEDNEYQAVRFSKSWMSENLGIELTNRLIDSKRHEATECLSQIQEIKEGKKENTDMGLLYYEKSILCLLEGVSDG